eukprot:1195767-Prorocentrum_minimum.AAC.2
MESRNSRIANHKYVGIPTTLRPGRDAILIRGPLEIGQRHTVLHALNRPDTFGGYAKNNRQTIFGVAQRTLRDVQIRPVVGAVCADVVVGDTRVIRAAHRPHDLSGGVPCLLVPAYH